MADKTPQELAEKAETPEQYRSAQAKEYGTYVALTDIDYMGVRVYNAGTPVPVSSVLAHGYEAQGVVARVASKTAQAAVSAAADAGDVAVEQPVSLAVPRNG